LNQLVNKGVEMAQSAVASPLAQLFQPLVVDDDMILEEPEESQSSQSGNPPLLSYGPASRRRLKSVNTRRPGTDFLAPPASVQGGGVRWGPSLISSRITEQQQISQSLEQQEQQEETEPETAEQVEEEEQTGGGEPRLMRRLHIMEERQKRIEDLLIELSKKIGSK
jgi:hypothetical protein